ncbi:TonB-dependent receptor [Pedobacter sp. PLR]|uniref:TonB-dependent receptor n=1 Tax=Pedobacter sp. PLR TaxID=2994465 RepID=UPI002245B08A|nr:TonB-dependent receptor [Pedobacter sp. PLR]MCX2453826.1 TonB-dependent receptor [Pedobacter sp. PLR]
MKFYTLMKYELAMLMPQKFPPGIIRLLANQELAKKIIMRAKLTLVLLITLFLQLSLGASAQRISLSAKNKDLKELFKQIGKQSGYQFLYADDMLSGTKRINIVAKNALLEEVLKQCFAGQPITYSIVDKTVIIKPVIFIKTTYFVVAGVLKGKVTEGKTGLSLPGVTIKLIGEGITQNKIADGEGNYIFVNLKPGNYQMTWNYIGYTPVSKDITIADGQNPDLNVALQEEASQLGELVVVGFGTQKKADLTGAVGVVNVDKALTSRPVTNVQELLAGTVPGLNISKGSGAAGSGASINIRGTSTIGGSSGVLVLIDGFPGNIYTLNPNDIESVSVLKDAASASIYGSRAANGVLLVTTKKGNKTGKPMVELNSSIGIQQPQFMLDFVGAADYMKLWDQVLINDGKEPIYGAKGLEDLAAGKYADNKWYMDIYKRNTLINNNSLAISGGSENVTYRVSGSYDYQDGTLPNNNYNKYTFRPDINIKISDQLKLSTNLQYTQTYIMQPQGGTDRWQSESARAAPISPIYTSNGQYGVGSSMVGNTIAGVNEGGYNYAKYKELFGVADLVYSPLENLNIKGSYARTSSDQRTTDRVLAYNLYDESGAIATRKNLVTALTESYGSNYRNVFQATADYDYQLNKHGFKALAGYSQEYYYNNSFSAYRDQLPFGNIDVLNTGASTNMQNSGTASDVAIRSYFGRLNYDYDGKYLFQANIRGDGSSRFAEGNKWGYFPSFSAGWNIHRESFFDVSWVNSLKVRGSWGILGDAEKVGYYPTAEVLTYNSTIYGFNGVAVPGAYNGVSVNKNITWEQSKQTNLGLDVMLLGQRLGISVDYFINKRDNILNNPPVSAEFGLPAPFSNLLKMDSKGWEFLLNYKDRSGEFNWGVDFNTSFSKNKVIDLAGKGPQIGNTYTDEGLQYQLPYGLKALGLFQSAEEIKNSPNQGPNVFPGNIKYQDTNNDKVIDGNDRVILNDKVVVRFGANFNFGWKNFDVSANVIGALNGMRYMSGYEGWAFYLSQNARPLALDNWTPDNPNATYPRLSIQNNANDTKYSSFWLRKADYIKIQNVQIGYQLPKAALTKLKLNSLRLFASVQNLATITNYTGFDPEGGYYPLSRTWSFGFNLKF